MEPWMERVASILDHSPARALPLSRLLTRIFEQGEVVAGREAWFLQRIKERPERFRVIPDRLGAWVLWPGLSSKPGLGPEQVRRVADPWIVTSSTAPAEFGVAGRFIRTVQDTVQAWGWGIDVGSQVSIARWIRAQHEGEEAVKRASGRGSP
jgi:hypothetical protein